MRRVNLDRSKESLLDYVDSKKYFLPPEYGRVLTADEAIRAARLAREVGLSDWVKVEVIGDQATLYPDVQGTVEAREMAVLRLRRAKPARSSGSFAARTSWSAASSRWKAMARSSRSRGTASPGRRPTRPGASSPARGTGTLRLPPTVRARAGPDSSGWAS